MCTVDDNILEDTIVNLTHVYRRQRDLKKAMINIIYTCIHMTKRNLTHTYIYRDLD